MVDLNKLSPPELKAAMTSGTAGWGEYGSVEAHVRYMVPVSADYRKRCCCGCKKRATNVGMCNGVAMHMAGCEKQIDQWVKGT